MCEGSSSGPRWLKDAMSKFGFGNPDKHSNGSEVGSGESPMFAPSQQDGRGLRIKVQTHRKNFKEFSDLRLVQSIYAHEGVIWAAKFSKSGKYLATAGQDGVVAVWKVNVKRDANLDKTGDGGGDRSAAGDGDCAELGAGNDLPGDDVSKSMQYDSANCEEAPGVIHGISVLYTIPYRLYRGHKKDVLDLAWSTSNFLLSASMDKSVRLWHVSVAECLKIFRHNDFVTAIAFHPANESLFLSGSIDGKVRLWDVAETRVVSWQDLHDMVTALAFSRNGSKAVVGSMRGKCRFYSLTKSNGLEYEAQLDVKNKRGQHARGKKITGLTFAPKRLPNSLLVTSNDSRIRMYDGYTLQYKYKGHANKSTQIKASFSPRGNFVVCGSGKGISVDALQACDMIVLTDLY